MAERTRIARCACGVLTATARGEPASVVMCSCTMCQRRSGSAFSLSSYWAAEAVTIDGPSTPFERPTDAGRIFTHHFCPSCGTALWYFGAHRPGMIGISAGCFTDPDFPLPRAAVWDTTRHHWLDHINDIPRLEKQRT
ncbi:MAG: GFA family protein [Pseudomonadota bacterium]